MDELKDFDAVVLATGGRVIRPQVPGIDLPLVATFEDVLRCKMTGCEFHGNGRQPPVECGQRVLIWGDHFGAAEKLAADGRQVFVVTENRQFAAWMEPCHRDVMQKRFAGSNGEGLRGKPFEYPVATITDSTVLAIGAGGEVALIDNQFRRSTLQVDSVVLASVEVNDDLYGPLLEAGIAVAKIGDCRKVHNLRAAVTEGANIGLTLDENLRLNANRAVISCLPTEVAAAGSNHLPGRSRAEQNPLGAS
ncbi:MAG: hypothetical protein KJZ87_13100 [Thermoguttaceae bacterium]|nr:hypothetical protein [Thermoguttaceae bacterium]